MYSRSELFDGFDPSDSQSYAATLDFSVYREYVAVGKYAPSDYFIASMRALHDNAITHALSEHLRITKARPVGIMGGHKLFRGSEPYRNVVFLSRELTRRGFLMLSGGGPGAMEATHLGALLAASDEQTVEAAIVELKSQEQVPDLMNLVGSDGVPNKEAVAAAHMWFAPAYEISVSAENPQDSLAVPTWLYGHEPSSPMAGNIAKYFQNSIREDGLLAVATNGAIYVEGRAGTLQEVFQDATQNYYKTFGVFSPMVFVGSKFWSESVPALPVLKALFKPDDFAKFVLVTDDALEAADFITRQSSQEPASVRIDRYLTHRVHGHEA
jgi:predicted Rossmann-fold nucleotide-binding protein